MDKQSGLFVRPTPQQRQSAIDEVLAILEGKAVKASSEGAIDTVLNELDRLGEDIDDVDVDVGSGTDTGCYSCTIGSLYDDIEDSPVPVIMFDKPEPDAVRTEDPYTSAHLERKKVAPADYLTRDDLMQAVAVAIEVLKGSKYTSDNYAAQSFLALQYGFEAVGASAPKDLNLHKFDQIEHEQNERIVRTSLAPADADRMMATTSPHALNRLIEASRRQGFETAKKMYAPKMKFGHKSF